MKLSRLRRAPLVVLLLSPVLAGTGWGQLRGAGRPVELRNRPPELLVTPDLASTQVVPGQRFDVRVEVHDPDGDPLTVGLVDPWAGMGFSAVGASGSVDRSFQVQVPRLRIADQPTATEHGLLRLTLVASDGRATVRRELSFRVQPHAMTVADVTGDGIQDVVAGADAVGELYVWEGAGQPGEAPRAILRSPLEAAAGIPADGFFTVDMTGDGVEDVVVMVRGPVRGSAVLVWEGGASLHGTPEPRAILKSPTGRLATFDRSLPFHDLNRDGCLDVVVHCHGTPTFPPPPPPALSGQVYVWYGGAGLASSGPDLALEVPSVAPIDGHVVVDDLSGDGRPDLLFGSKLGDLFLWENVPGWSGAPAPSARFVGRPSTGEGFGLPWDEGLRLADVTGDGRLDLISASICVQEAPSTGRGAVYVWAGRGAGFSGTQAPDHVLVPPTGVILGTGVNALELLDLDGDGVTDLLAPSNSGPLNVWRGGTLGARQEPTWTLVDDVLPLGQIDRSFLPLQDLDGDGVPEVLARVPVAPAGRVLVWSLVGAQDGPVAPVARLEATENVFFSDLTRDGVLDVIAQDGEDNASNGAVRVWHGGAGFVAPTGGLRTPDAVLVGGGRYPGRAFDFDPSVAHPTMLVDDVTGDGVSDVLSLSRNPKELHMWVGSARTGNVPRFARLAWPGQSPVVSADGGVPLATVDLDGDGRRELVLLDARASFTGQPDHGAVFVYRAPEVAGNYGPEARLLARPDEVRPRLGSGAVRGSLFVDVTGDGLPEVLSASPRADALRGAIYVFDARTLPGRNKPLAKLRADGSRELAAQGVRF